MGYNFKKIAAMAIISMAVVLSITGCNQNADADSAFQTLDIEQLETDTTDINDRAEYYDKNVDDRIDEMTDEEKEKFYVNLTLTYTGREYYEEDYIIFLRNDNVYEAIFMTETIRLDSYTQKKMTFFFDPDGLPLELHE